MEDSGSSSDGIVGCFDDDGFDDPNIDMRRAHQFVNANGKKHLAIYQMLKVLRSPAQS